MKGLRKRKKVQEDNADDKGKQKRYRFYAVAAGIRQGIYNNWLKCSLNVTGVSKSKYKGFGTLAEAKKYLEACGVECTLVDFTEDDITQEEDDGECSTQISDCDMPSLSSSISLAGETKQPCNDCSHTTGLISTLIERIKSLEITVANQSEKISSLEANLNTLMTSTMERVLENIQKIPTISTEPSIKPLKTFSEALSGTNKEVGNTNSTKQFTNLKSPSPKPKEQTKQINTLFKPNQCIVVNLSSESPLVKNFDQDIIRKNINQTFGPTIVERITRYKLTSDKPKMMLQLTSQATAEKIVGAWRASLFGGSTVRLTISPMKQNELSLLVKGVPLTISETALQEETETYYPGCNVFRFKKDGQILRTVKVTFEQKEHLDEVLSKGFMLRSENMLFYVERINHNQHNE